MQDTTHTGDTDEWSQAIAYLREEYDDSYGARIALGGDMARTVDGMPQEAIGETTLQPIIRYQKVAPEEVLHLLGSRFGEETADKVRDAIIQYVREARE